MKKCHTCGSDIGFKLHHDLKHMEPVDFNHDLAVEVSRVTIHNTQAIRELQRWVKAKEDEEKPDTLQDLMDSVSSTKGAI